MKKNIRKPQEENNANLPTCVPKKRNFTTKRSMNMLTEQKTLARYLLPSGRFYKIVATGTPMNYEKHENTGYKLMRLTDEDKEKWSYVASFVSVVEAQIFLASIAAISTNELNDRQC